MHVMEQVDVSKSKLFFSSPIEEKDDFEERLERSDGLLKGITVEGLAEKKSYDTLISYVSKSAEQHEIVCFGLLHVILTDSQNAPKAFRDLTLITQDGLAYFLAQVNAFVTRRLCTCLDGVRMQCVWLLGELMRSNVPAAEQLCNNIIRHIVGGDVSSRNLQLCDAVVDVLINNRPFIDKYRSLISMVVYTFLRLMEDHYDFPALQAKEANFVNSLMREYFMECTLIGRDFIRLLQQVARIPVINDLWKDILTTPQLIHPSFQGVHQILCQRTSRRMLQSRLTPEMEERIVFLASGVRLGCQRRYQEWFERAFLNTDNSHTLRADLIRFVVNVIHPTNEMLSSDVIPRWALIGWLLTTCPNPVATQHSKLALFYDWLYHDPEKDNIMNIEPAILLISYSLRTHPPLAASLLDFLCRVATHYCPFLSEAIFAGIKNSLYDIVQKRVVPSVTSMLDSPKLDKDLRTLIVKVFPEFCDAGSVGTPALPPPVPPQTPPPQERSPSPPYQAEILPVEHKEASVVPVQVKVEMEEKCLPVEISAPTPVESSAVERNHVGEKFGNGGEDTMHPVVRLERLQQNDVKQEDSVPPWLAEPLDVGVADAEKEQLKVSDFRHAVRPVVSGRAAGIHSTLPKKIQELMTQLRENSFGTRGMEIMEALVLQVLEERPKEDLLENIAASLCVVLEPSFRGRVLPTENRDAPSLEESTSKPLYALFCYLTQIPDGDKNKDMLLHLTAEMYSIERGLGYRLLYYLETKGRTPDHALVYRGLCEALDSEIKVQLRQDLELCLRDDQALFFWLLPSVFSLFPSAAYGNQHLMHLMMDSCDTEQICLLLQAVAREEASFFRKDSLYSVLKDSLDWETWSQECVWKLATQHPFPCLPFLCVMPHLSEESHAHTEAKTAVLSLLREEPPRAEVMRAIFSWPITRPNSFTGAIFNVWIKDDTELVAESLVENLHSGATPRKRKRGKGSGPEAEQVLMHLESVRLYCKRNAAFFNNPQVRKTVMSVEKTLDDKVRERFSAFFASCRDDKKGKAGGVGSGSRGSSGRNRVRPGNKTGLGSDSSENEEDSDDDDEIVAPNKKRIKPDFPSDSD